MSRSRPDLRAAHDETGARGSRQEELIRELLLEKYQPIAIVGMGLRFPGGNDTPAEFERFLRAGGSGTGPIPTDRWDAEKYFSDAPGGRKGKISAAGGGFLQSIDQFDPKFFNLSPKEAQFIDPQHRLALETAWEALEDANIDPTALIGTSGGVYFGISCFDYTLEIGSLSDDELDAHAGTGTAHSAVPGRLSYLLGWRGPSIAIDTACSSSIVALDLAVQGLRRGECDIALCGGVNAIHHPFNHIVFSQAGMLSPDGKCKTFDDSADGYARSEGCGVVVLKRYADAKRDGDRVLALVRGTAVRQDGQSAGLTAPNGVAQELVMGAALSNACLGPADIQYVEAHGTGTSLGDPIEMGSINGVFGNHHTADEPLTVGSLKTNVGHMEAAAGIGGLIKTVLQLQHARFYPHLNVVEPSKHIPWDKYPVRLPMHGSAWPSPVRRAVVNSFGFAGTIASAVMEQAPPVEAAGTTSMSAADHDSTTRAEIFALSAKSKGALQLQLRKYNEFLLANPAATLADICYTAGVGRAHFDERVAGVVTDRDELARLLSRDPTGPGDEPPKIAMLFTGQGSQYVGMGHCLYERHPVFRAHFDECDRLFRRHLGLSIKDVILDKERGDSDITQTRFTQPALFTLEFATAKLWQSWGIEPNILIGHSIGEVVAAAVAGLFCLEDAVLLVAARSRLMQSVTAPGGMVSARADIDLLRPLVAAYPELAFAAMNAPGHCVISGGRGSLDALVGQLVERGIQTTRLPVSHAFHSPLMDSVFEDFAAAIAAIRFQETDITMISNVTGTVATADLIANPDYWVRHIGEPVNFLAGMKTIAQRGRHAFIEVGPAATLLGLGRLCLPGTDHNWLSSMHPDDDAGGVITRSVTDLYRAGLPISWPAYYRGREADLITLPTYAFDRRKYWLPASGRRRPQADTSDHHPLLGAEVTTPEQTATGNREFCATIAADNPGYLRDHVVMGQVVVPAAAYVEMLLALQDAVFGETSHPLRSVEIHEPLILAEDPAELRIRMHVRTDGGADVEVVSRVAGEDQVIDRRHVTAQIGAENACLPVLMECADDLHLRATASPQPSGVEFSEDDLYSDFADLGLTYGHEFRRIVELSRPTDAIAVGTIRGHDTSGSEILPPFLLDNVIQSVAGVLDDGLTYLPVRFGTLQLLKKPKSATLRSLLRITSEDRTGSELTADMVLLEGTRTVCVVQGLGFRRVLATQVQPSRLHHQSRWVKRSLLRKAGTGPRRILTVNARAGMLGDVEEQLAAAAEIGFRHVPHASEAEPLLSQWQPTDVCWFWRSTAGSTPLDTLRAECELNYRDLLTLLESLERSGFGTGQRLWLITERAQHLPGEAKGDVGPHAASTLWGFGRSLWNEMPTYRPTLIDLSGDGECAPLLEELLVSEPDEFQVVYRGGHRHVARIYATDPVKNDDDNFALEIGKHGDFANIIRTPVVDRDPQGNEVSVQIHAAGLNFKDVLNALGLLKQHADERGLEYQPLPLGFEGGGVVVAVGPEAEFSVGDEVIVSHLGCMRRRVVVPSDMVVRKPENIDFAQAAGLPTAYVTAYYALHHLAGIRAGDRVLIHAAAGGVGQAAVALARLAGAEVFGTASPESRISSAPRVLNM